MVGERVRVARLPVTTDRNPYQSLLYRHLRSEGVDLVGNGRLAPEWLEANREAVDLLHVHWRLDRLVDDDEPIGPPRDWTPATAVEATKRLRDQLELARSLGYAIAWTVHEIARLGGDEPTLEHLAAVELGATADVVLTHNQVATAHVIDLGLAPSDRVVTVPLGHYGDAHPTTGVLTRADLAIAEEATVFLAFGQQRTDKALALLLEAFRRLDRDDVVLVVAGHHDLGGEPGTDDAGIRHDERVVVLGSVPDDQVVPLHHLADAAVVARGYEWTPSSLVLSLSHGLPTVAADLASVNEHGGPGVFPFHPGDAADLSATLARVADDPDERRIRGAAGRAFVRSITWQDTARATAAAFSAALDR